MSEYRILMEGITKKFPGVTALNEVTLRVKAGSVHALMGENGAGKSTLMKCLFGVYKKDEGNIFIDGERVEFASSGDALLGGVAMVHQELNQALKLSVAENMWLGRFPKYKKSLPFINEKKMIAECKRIFQELGISIDPEVKTERLSVSQRQMLEIAKAVSYNARVIVFDEPTSSLNGEEAERLFEIIKKLKNNGCSIIYISHKMDEILRICDFVTVMRDGRHIATKEASEISTDEIIRLMVGREVSNRYPKRENPIGNTLLTVEGLSSEYSNLRDVSFDLCEGEILGVAGLDGSGRTELVENLFGLAKRRCGRIFLHGKEIYNRNAREAIENGFALVTEERRRSGIFAILPIRENSVISTLSRFKKFGILSAKRMDEAAELYSKRLRVKAPGIKTKIRTLSGGNQQKVIFARWLMKEPTVLLLDEPTRGIDIGAKYEIYTLIASLSAEARGVILISSEMPELIGLCDRIMVMSGGRCAGILDKNPSQEEIMALATKYL